MHFSQRPIHIFLFGALFAAFTAHAGPSLEEAFQRGKAAISKSQSTDGSFTNLVNTSSTIYTTQMVLLYEYLGMIEEKRPIVEGLMRWTWNQQNPDGGLPGYLGAPSDISISVQTYLAARIAGESEDSPRMKRLAEFFIPRRNYTKELLVRPFLMTFGLDDSARCLPEFVETGALALRSNLPWIKDMLYPFLHILLSGHVHELSPEKTPVALGKSNFCSRSGWNRNITEGKPAFWDWIDGAFNSDGTLFDYTPTTIPGLMALSTYEMNDERKERFNILIKKGLAKLETDQIHHADGAIQQSPGDAAVAETTVVLLGMTLSGVSSRDPMLEKAKKFVLSSQLPATGAFGMPKNCEKHPDSDDTSTSITTLRLLMETDGTYQLPENADLRAKLKRGVDWALGLQNRDGGFATWEKDRLGVSKSIFNLTGMVLSESVMEHSARAAAMLSLFRDESPIYARAHDRVLHYIRSNQLCDGSYSGTWFIDYVFGTAMAINALATTPENDYADPSLQASITTSIQYIAEHQREDGGFSESPDSFLQKRSVPLATSSPSQTGLITSALLSFSKFERYRNWKLVQPIIDRSIAYLVATQKADGLWHDPTLTGVVFPKIEYAIYPTLQEVFPLQAIGMYLNK